MSQPTEPYANGFGILLGILILWVGTAVVLLAGKALVQALLGL